MKIKVGECGRAFQQAIVLTVLSRSGTRVAGATSSEACILGIVTGSSIARLYSDPLPV
jgi:hypothetical protein